MREEDVRTASESGVIESASPLADPGDRASWIGFSAVALSLISALATFLILTGLTPITPSNNVVVTVLFVNVLLIAAMIAVIAWQAYGLWQAWRQKQAGARLHVRIVLLFSIIAALPAILLAAAATTTFSRSLDSWFSNRTRLIINNSLDVAKAYVDEHGLVIRNDIANMARDVDAALASGPPNPTQLAQLLTAQAGLRDLSAAYIIDHKGKLKVTPLDKPEKRYRAPRAKVISKAEGGNIPVLTLRRSSSIAAIAKLPSADGWYLYASRPVSKKVLGYLDRTAQGVSEYNALRKASGGLKLAHGLLYTMISTTALLAAVWVGFWFANRFAAPIRRLIAGAREVSTGNLEVELPERRGEGDLRRLSPHLQYHDA